MSIHWLTLTHQIRTFAHQFSFSKNSQMLFSISGDSLCDPMNLGNWCDYLNNSKPWITSYLNCLGNWIVITRKKRGENCFHFQPFQMFRCISLNSELSLISFEETVETGSVFICTNYVLFSPVTNLSKSRCGDFNCEGEFTPNRHPAVSVALYCININEFW